MKRMIAALLAVVMVFNLVPVQAFAQETIQDPSCTDATIVTEETTETQETTEETLPTTEPTTLVTEPEETAETTDTEDAGTMETIEIIATADAVLESQSGDSGSCGTDAVWSLDDSGTLSITGTGAIDAKAFTNNTNITSVVIAAGISSIGSNAFSGCTALTSIELPEGLTSIGASAFANTGLTSLILPEGITTIGEYFLSGNTGVTEITIPSTVTSFSHSVYSYGGLQGSAVEKVIFAEGMTTVPLRSAMNASNLKEVVLPSTLQEIGNNAFDNCTALSEIKLPEGLKSIGSNAFVNTALTSLILPEGITTIGNEFLRGNTGITEITIPSTVTSFGHSVYSYGGLQGSAVEKVIFAEGMTTLPLRSAMNAGNLKEVVLPSTLQEIGNNAFDNCTALTEIKLPEGLKSIGSNAFVNTALTSLILPEGITAIGNEFLRGNTGITEITIPSTVTSFGHSVYSYGGLQGSAVEKVIFAEGMTAVPLRSAMNAGNLKEVVLPSTLQEIGNNAFDNCTALSEIKLPEGLKSIGSNAFVNTALTSLILPEGITAIGHEFLRGNTGITEITIPSTVTSFGHSVYGYGGLQGSAVEKVIFAEGMTTLPLRSAMNASNLKEVVLPSTLQEIGNNAFDNCTALTEIKLPEGLKSIGTGAFVNTALTSLILPEGITAIGHEFLRGNTGITEITIPSTVTSFGHSVYGYGGLQGSAVEKVTFAEGMTTIPLRSAMNASNLREVILPESTESISKEAFSNCGSLTYINIPDSVQSIHSSAFSGSTGVVIHCNTTSYAAMYAVENDLAYVTLDEFVDSDNYVLNRDGSEYYVGLNSVAANGYVAATVQYDIKEQWQEKVSDMKLKVVLPHNVILDEETLRLDGVLCKDYTYDGNRALTIPVTAVSGSLKFYLDVSGQKEINSYAALTFTKNGKSTHEVIQIIDETVNALTLFVPDSTNSASIRAEGTSPAGAEIILYVDGAEQKRTTASLAGNWSAELQLPSPEDFREYSITAKAVTGSGTLSQDVTVLYHSNEPVLTDFVMQYNNHNKILSCDLLNSDSIKPKVYFLPNTQFDFSVKFENAEELESVYVVSTRNNVKKYLEAEYNPQTGAFETDGFFDEQNKDYVPGTLHVEYHKKTEQVLVADTYDWSVFKANESPLLDNVTVLEATDTDSSVSIDLGDLGSDLAGVFAEASISIYDEATDGDLNDWLGVFADGDTLASYVIPGYNDEKYIATLDYSDPYTYVMLVKDVSGSKFIKLVLSTAADDPANAKNALKIADVSSTLGTVNTVAGILLKQHEIETEMNELREEVWQTSYATPEQRQEALRQVDHLERDQSYFYLFTAVIPVVLASSAPVLGATMTVAPIMFTALMGVMLASAPIFYGIRTANIKSGKFRVDFVVDPSGYVYDAITKERIEGVSTTAYCIRYDGTDTFWDAAPDQNEYGTLWNASEYDQQNPLVTNADGKYAWDVPEGWWRVKYEKESYETAWSEWLPVPPPQTEVNIALTPLNNGGYCGDGVTWSLDDAGTLTISGSGTMDNYSEETGAPWNNNASSVTKVIFESSVTNIGSHAFAECVNLKTIVFAGDAPTIAENAFIGLEAVAYYPSKNATWTKAVQKGYGGEIQWMVNGVQTVPMYRMYDPNSGEHFYTGAELERDFLVQAGWHYEGVGFNFPEEGEPVYRLYEPVYGEHLYTMDKAEVDKLIGWGWRNEGVAFNSAGTDEVPQYRLHNPNAQRGGYHFTGSEAEKDFLISIGWINEGIGWYSCEE